MMLGQEVWPVPDVVFAHKTLVPGQCHYTKALSPALLLTVSPCKEVLLVLHGRLGLLLGLRPNFPKGLRTAALTSYVGHAGC